MSKLATHGAATPARTVPTERAVVVASPTAGRHVVIDIESGAFVTFDFAPPPVDYALAPGVLLLSFGANGSLALQGDAESLAQAIRQLVGLEDATEPESAVALEQEPPHPSGNGDPAADLDQVHEGILSAFSRRAHAAPAALGMPLDESGVLQDTTLPALEIDELDSDAVGVTQSPGFAVAPVADAPSLSVSPASGNEDSAIPLSISSALTDIDGSESLSITVSGVPNGATLSAGTDLGGGVWQLTAAQLAGLTITPPADSDADFTLMVTATSTEAGGGTASTSSAVVVTVNPVADAPPLTVSDTSGNEDSAIALSIGSALADTDGSESLSITVSGVPAGASLSAGTDLGGGVWQLTAAQVAGLTITPPANSDADFTLMITATSTEAVGGAASTSSAIAVTVNPVADAPTLSVADASGNQDSAIPVSISAALTDTDGSESLNITISGVPTGAVLSAGTNRGGGVWLLTADQLAGLTMSLPANSNADFTLTVTAASTESGGGAASVSGAIHVSVDFLVDAPTLSVANAGGNEDDAIALSIAASLTDAGGADSLSIRIAGVPAGAVLSAGTDLGGGIWQLNADQLAGLTVTPPADSDADFTLTVTATRTGPGGDTASTIATIAVTVDPVADAPTLSVADASGNEDSSIPLSIGSGLADTDGSESLSVAISGIPTGATLSAGTDLGGGVWQLTAAQLAGLTITPPANSDADFFLTVTATSTETGGGTASTSGTIAVTVNPVADAPTLTVANAAGNEDSAIALSIGSTLADTDSSESLAVTISGIPAGATLSAGTNLGGGVWRLTAAQLAGLTITPPTNSDAGFTLTVIATSTEAGGGTASTSGTIAVSVNPVADAPTLSVSDASGNEDSAIALSIGSALADTDGSESLSITVSGVPSGASLSAGANLGGGVWQLTAAQLAGLTITSPTNSDTDFTLTVTATSTEAGGGTASTSGTIAVTVNPEADAPTLSVADASGNEDSSVPLSISAALTDTDGSESLSISISGVPTGATLSAGTDLGGGVWQLTVAQLAGLTITPPANSDADFTLTVTATGTETGGGAASTSGAISVTVNPVADTPTLSISPATGDQDTAISLSISSALTDTDGSESLSIRISDVPTGATLSAGTNLGGGVWQLNSAQLAGLTITPPAGSDADFTLTVSATSAESGGGIATASASLGVTVNTVVTLAPLFSSGADSIDFASVASGSYQAGTQYDALRGNDTVLLPASAGAATAAGYDSTQTFHGGAGNDTITGGALADLISGDANDDVLSGGAGNDTLDGGAGTDTADYSGASSAVTVSLAAGTATGGAGSDSLSNIENVTGSSSADSLTGDSGANSLSGGGANDTLIGGTGNDTLDGGSGTDTADYSGASSAVTVNLSTGTATGGAGSDTLSNIENIVGSGSSDSLTGDANANSLTGGNGNDTISAGGGNDTLVWDSQDKLDGGTGFDTVDANRSSGDDIDMRGSNISNVEYAVTGSGDDRVRLTLSEILSETSDDQFIAVLGSGSDRVDIDVNGGWTITTSNSTLGSQAAAAGISVAGLTAYTFINGANTVTVFTDAEQVNY